MTKTETNLDLTELLDYLDPGEMDYTEWLAVGFALKEAGYPCSVWDEWSRRDPGRYHVGEAFRKWDSFKGHSVPITAGTLVQMAKERGWSPAPAGHELDWGDAIGARDEQVVGKKGWVEEMEIREPETWNPAEQLLTYLDVLFNDDENVGYVTEVWDKDGRLLPTAGNFDRTAGQLKAELRRCNGDLGAVLGDPNPEAGAWIRFNPLDGKGVRNDNVTDLRFALVESDETELGQQNAILRELELPIAALVYSGGKSLHAIVHIDAPNYEEYRKRVEFLYEICRWQGFKAFFLSLCRIGFFSVLAIGMTAILELPALAALQTTQSSVNNFPEGFRLNIASENTWKGLLDAMRQVAGNMGGGLEPNFKEGLPNLYCGVGTIVLAFLYLTAKDVKFTDKLCAVGLLLFFNVSFIIRQLDYIWHGFHFTNMIPYRFSFLYSFVMLYMAYRAWLLRGKFQWWQLAAAGLLSVGIVLCSNKRTDAAFLAYNLGFLVLYMAALIYGRIPVRHAGKEHPEPEGQPHSSSSDVLRVFHALHWHSRFSSYPIPLRYRDIPHS